MYINCLTLSYETVPFVQKCTEHPHIIIADTPKMYIVT